MAFTGKQLTTRLDADGTLTVQIVPKTWEAPTGSQVLVQIEATPINPSDLGLLFASADTANAAYTPGKVVAKMPDNATRAMTARHGLDMPAGNEAAGIVVAAGGQPCRAGADGQARRLRARHRLCQLRLCRKRHVPPRRR